MKVTIIIPVKNRKENIIKVLTCLQRQEVQDHHAVKIIVVDDNSTDGTREAIEAYIDGQKFPFHLKLIHTEQRDTWSASIPRNLGAKSADEDTDCFYFLDSDILLPPNRIQRLIDDWEHDPDPNRVIIGAYHYAQTYIWVDDADWYKQNIQNYGQDVRFKSFEEHPVEEKNTGVGFALACFGGSLLVPRPLFFKSGMYDEFITSGCEDGDYGLTLWETGAVFSMDKELLGWHNPHPITPDRTSEIPEMVKYIDEKHHMDLIKASGEAYRQWDISWQAPNSWKEKA